jgi:hypothetical protein
MEDDRTKKSKTRTKDVPEKIKRRNEKSKYF